LRAMRKATPSTQRIDRAAPVQMAAFASPAPLSPVLSISFRERLPIATAATPATGVSTGVSDASRSARRADPLVGAGGASIESVKAPATGCVTASLERPGPMGGGTSPPKEVETKAGPDGGGKAGGVPDGGGYDGGAKGLSSGVVIIHLIQCGLVVFRRRTLRHCHARNW